MWGQPSEQMGNHHERRGKGSKYEMGGKIITRRSNELVLEVGEAGDEVQQGRLGDVMG